MSKSSVFQSVSVTESDLPNLLSQVQTSETNAANSAAAAATSAASVGTSASNAATEASNAANSATAAANSASAASTSASAAATSENNASSHVTSANNHATNAATSATSAANSQVAAASSETNAATSETNAATSATNASTSETNAATSATNAATSATSASTQVTNATNQATAAANSATAAANSASAASTSETNAQTHANTASGHATTASTQATNAATSATNAATSETNAGTQATNAATSATNAASSATNAATAQTAAESARDSALAAFDSFDDRYLGTKTSDPSTDNDGNTLVAGTLYFNSSTSTMMLYTGSAWVAAYVSGGSFATLSGATFTGDVTVPNLITSGNVDGRDVSVDGAKLDGIEASATADQTAAEIRTLVESATDSNVFTDADHTKLNGIAAGATAVSSLTDLSISDGTNGQALKTDGAGNFSFGDVATSTAFTDITGKPTTLSGYGITDALANNAVGEIAADGVPFTVNSTNSNNFKLGFENNGTVEGYLGTTSSVCLYAGDSSGNGRFWITQSAGEVKQVSSGTNAYYRFYSNGANRNYLYQSGSSVIGFLTTTGGWAFQCDNSGNVTATGNVTAYSDIRLKDDIQPIEGALERVNKLEGVEYTRKSTGEREIGFIAQDVIEHEPTLVDVVDTSTEHTDEAFTDLHVMKYQNTVALLVEAIKELKAEVAELRAGCCHGAAK